MWKIGLNHMDYWDSALDTNAVFLYVIKDSNNKSILWNSAI